MATAAVPATESLSAAAPEYRLTPAGALARTLVALGIVVGVFALPLLTDLVWDDKIAIAAIFAIIGLSIRILTGYAGQISLGHQAFVGIGAFMSAYLVGEHVHASFFLALPVAGLVGALLALGLGLVALRVRGLYLALVTLSFGLVAQATIFNWRAFTGGGAGAAAPRPSLFHSNQAYAYLCLLFLALFLIIDWRMSKTKGGRAVVAVRNNERVAATLGVNVTGFKLFAFAVSGFIAGVAGSLIGHQTQFVYANNFDLRIALLWVIMAVVGGLGSRAGVVIGSAFFALFADLLALLRDAINWHIAAEKLALASPILGAVLLLLTLTLYPGGIGQQLLPIRRWLAGGPFAEPGHGRRRRTSQEEEEEAPPEDLFETPQPEPTVQLTAVGREAPGPGGATDDEDREPGPAEPTTKIPAIRARERRGLRSFRRRRAEE